MNAPPSFRTPSTAFQANANGFSWTTKKDMGTKLLSKAFKQIWTLKFVDEIIKAIIELDHKTKTKKRKKKRGNDTELKTNKI